jgi:hypothetical protein
VKHNDLDLLNTVRTMTADELDDLVLRGKFNLTTLDYPSPETEKPIELAGGWRLHFIQPKPVNPKFKPKKRIIRVNVTSTDQRTGKIRCSGEDTYAYEAGLDIDHAYNWRNNLNPNRYRHLNLLVELQNNKPLREYIRTCPVIVSEQVFDKWLKDAPTTCRDFKSLERGEVARLIGLMDQVIRSRMTYVECHEMREDQKEERGRITGKPYTRRPPRQPRESSHSSNPDQKRTTPNHAPRQDDYRNKGKQHTNGNRQHSDQGARDFNRVPGGGIGEFLSAKPNYEDRKRGNKRDRNKSERRYSQ